MFQLKILKINQKAVKNDKSVRNKNKNLFTSLKFYLFYEIKIKLPVDSFYFSDKEQKKMKKSQICNMPQQSYSQF